MPVAGVILHTPHIIVINDILEQDFYVENILIISSMQAIIEPDKRRMIDTVAMDVFSRSVLVNPQSSVVLDLQAEVLDHTVLPKIKAPRNLSVRHEGRVMRVGGVNSVVKVNERKGVSPLIGIKEFERSRDTWRTPVGTSRIETAEIIIYLYIRPCIEPCGADKRKNKDGNNAFHGMME
jgi:hypothetical protein